MPTKYGHSISGPDLDALRAGTTEPRIPQWSAAPGVNAYAPPVARPAPASQIGGIVVAVAAVAVVVALGVFAMRGLRAPVAPAPVAVQPQLVAPTVAVVRETVVVVVTATPAPVSQPVPAGQSAPAAPRSHPVVQPQPQPVYIPPAPPSRPAPARRQTYVAPSYPATGGIVILPGRGEPVAYQSVSGGNAAAGSYQCAEQGVRVTDMDRAMGDVKIDGATMYLSNNDGGPLTPPTYRRLTNCRPK